MMGHMSEIVAAGTMLLVLLASTVAGMAVRPLLPEAHRSRETVELVQLVNGMMVTFAALVLGLLTASAKGAFDQNNNNLRTLSAQIVRLDGALRLYGPLAEEARFLLRQYTAAVISDSWPDEPKPAGDYPQQPTRAATDAPLESSGLGALLDRLEHTIRDWRPEDDYHRQVQADCVARYQQLAATRWALIEQAHGSISAPFYDVLMFWLAVIFLSFGLSAPRNALVLATVFLGAVSIASVVYVILDLDSPLTGLITIGSAPVRDALAHLDR
jgi:hypothetical protein